MCNPLGKSGGALIQQFMILTFGSLANSTPYLGGILLVIVLSWLSAARSLDKQFSSLAKQELKKERMLKEKVENAVLGAKELKEKENGSLHESLAISENLSNGLLPAKQELADESENSSETPTRKAK